MEEILYKYAELTSLNPDILVHGKERRKTLYQCEYEKLINYIERLKTYARHIEICGYGSYNNYIYRKETKMHWPLPMHLC